MATELQEWQRHVRVNRVSENMTWCGRAIPIHEWVFLDLDHAFNSLQRKDRLLICPDCAKVLGALLAECLTSDSHGHGTNG